MKETHRVNLNDLIVSPARAQREALLLWNKQAPVIMMEIR